MIFNNNLYNYLNANNLITKNQSGFCVGVSRTNQLLCHVDKINHAFDCTKSLEVLDITEAFEVWNNGLIFELEQNGIPYSVLKLLQHYLNR